jgi:hypothetical protein
MPPDRSLIADGTSHGSRARFVWVSLLGFLVGIWLWLALSSGGYPAENWVFPAFVLGLVGLTVGALLAYPRRPPQLSLTVLTLFGAYAIWVVLSTLWAASDTRAWLASGRTFAYLLVLTLALALLTSSQVRAAFRYLIMLAAFVLLAVSIWRIWSTPDLAVLFSGNRLVFPTGRADSTAALFLVSFWPLMWLAAGPGERAPVRGVALGLATGLLGVSVMTQSHGAAWSMVISLVLMFIFSPGRVRLLFYLVVPGLLMVYAAPVLDRYWTLGTFAAQGGQAGRTLTVAIVAAAFMGMIIALLEDWVRVSGRMKAIFGTFVLVACAAGLIYAAVTTTLGNGGSISWMSETWRQFLDEPVESGQTTGESTVTRRGAWSQTWDEFQRAPVVGAGADSTDSGPGDPPSRPDEGPSSGPREPDSVVLQVLSDTGIVGAVLGFGAMLVAVAGMLWPRLMVGLGRLRQSWRGDGRDPTPSRWGADPMAYGWQMALFVGAAYWFVHANMEWLWPMPGVTIPALLMLAAGVAATDAQAGTMWPRLSRWVTRTAPAGSARPPSADAGHRPGPEAASMQTAEPAETASDAHDEPATQAAATASGLSQYAAVPAAERRSRWSPVGRLRPPGPLSQAFRIALVVVSAFVLILAGTAYLLLMF